MKKSTSVILAFCISIIASFFLGRYTASNNTTLSEKTTTTKKLIKKDKDSTDSKINEVANDDKNESIKEEKDKITPKLEKVDHEIKVKQVTGALARTKTGISDKKIGEILSSIAQNLENKKLSYVSSLMQDCSGIYHQLKDSIQKRIPSLAASSGSFKYPLPINIRSSRQIADWYYKNNNLLLVEDAMASRNSIRPGSVLFFGKSNKVFKNITIELLTNRSNNYTSNGAIGHIAVVTAITTDSEGNVIDYTMMHGRNPKRHASRTGSKAVQSKNTPNLPPFGNWKQQLVAIANIVTASS